MSTIAVTDKDLLQRVEQALGTAAPQSAPVIDVGVSRHVVTLRGSVRSSADHAAAIEAARRARGVCTIADEIGVRPDPVRSANAALAASMEELLERCPTVPNGVTATIRDEVVTLEGVVDWAYQKTEAGHVVNAVATWRAIENNLVVRSLLAPCWIRERIVDAFRRDAERAAAGVGVHVEGREVVLSGRVNSLEARHRAEDAARAVPGVVAVHNAIAVERPAAANGE